MSESNPADPASLEAQLAQAGISGLSDGQISQFSAYLGLLLKWNGRTNLTAVRSREEIISRHLVESIACARLVPLGVETLLDLGSGAGLPGIPIAICRPEVAVTLAESQNKKAAFLNEALRHLGLNASVFAGRAETSRASFDCVALRAVDRMIDAIQTAVLLLRPGGHLLVLTSDEREPGVRSVAGVAWNDGTRLPGSARRLAVLGIRD